uniref:Alpha-carbonic anhydrase domain-containing protein n=1 Tax=Alexandrium monilatum TaxID=311494 RepID=A0A7S4S209_9DINO
MTVPPCAEVVTWLVRTEAVVVPLEHVHRLRARVFALEGGTGNNRATMPLNGREVSVLAAARWAGPPPAGTTGGVPPGSGAGVGWQEATERELRAATRADAAMRVAERAEEHLKGLGARVQEVAEARETGEIE